MKLTFGMYEDLRKSQDAVLQTLGEELYEEAREKLRYAVNLAVFQKAQEIGVSVYDFCFSFVPVVEFQPDVQEFKINITFRALQK